MGNTTDLGEEAPNPDAAKFYELLETASKLLFDGCVHSNELIPEQTEHPRSHYDAKKLVSKGYMSGRGSRGSSQSSRGRGRGRGRAAPSSEHTPSPSPTTSTPGTSHVSPTIPPAPPAPSPQPAATDPQQLAPSPQANADSSHASQPDPPSQQVVREGFTWPEEQKKQIRKVYDYRAGRRYQQIMADLRDRELRRLKWMSDTLRGQLLHRFATDEGFKKRQASSKKNRASSKGGCLHTGRSATISKTRARMTRSLDREPTDAKVFRETHTRKRDRSIVEKRADDLLIEFSANLEQATQQAQEEGDESAATVDPNVVWRQTLSEPYRNRVYGAGGFFASSLRKSGYAGSSASASSSHIGPADLEVVDLREQVQNLTQSLESQGHMLQQQIDEVKTLRDTLAQMAQRDERTEEHLRRMEEIQRQMAAFYNPLRPGASATTGDSDTSTAPPLPPRPPPPPPPPQQPDHNDDGDDDDYEDA
ncbi:hypothetical protein PIB30_027706 [Stylosanthes scabra]|uniref:Uncharacterized protein n=1 Tax=Stylosanthes scabra TaxID=79078 RepID=A0ABU6V9T3_9FABA|nr:hypothetical protein [Stylosanthes scabra]